MGDVINLHDKIEELRSRNWLKRNSISKNEDYVVKTLEHYDFQYDKDFRITCSSSGDCDILLNFNNKAYRIEVDDQNRAYNLLGKDTIPSLKDKHRYHFIKDFHGDGDILLDIIKYIKKKNKLINNKGVM